MMTAIERNESPSAVRWRGKKRRTRRSTKRRASPHVSARSMSRARTKPDSTKKMSTMTPAPWRKSKTTRGIGSRASSGRTW